MTRHKKGNIKSHRHVPQWFLANCVRTADELKNLQARIAISYDTRSKGKTGVSSDSYMVNSSVYKEILDHLPTHFPTTEKGTGCRGRATSPSQPGALVLKLPGDDNGGQGFLTAIVEKLAQHNGADLISLDIDDLRDLAEHFCKTDLDSCGGPDQDYLDLCFRDKSHEDDLSEEHSMSDPQSVSNEEVGDDELALRDDLGDIFYPFAQDSNTASRSGTPGGEPMTDQHAYEEDYSRGSIDTPHEPEGTTTVEANHGMPFSTYPEAGLCDDEQYWRAISQDDSSDILFETVLNSGKSKRFKATQQSPRTDKLPETRVGLKTPAITVLSLTEIDKFISVRPWARIADALSKAVKRARDTKVTVIVIMTCHDRNLWKSDVSGCCCEECRREKVAGKLDSMVSKLTLGPAKPALKVFPIRSPAQETLFCGCHTECMMRSNIRELKRSLRRTVKPRAVAIAQPYKEWNIARPVLMGHLGNSRLSTQSIDQLAKLIARDPVIERALQVLEQHAERALALSQWMDAKAHLPSDLQSLIERIRQDKETSKEELKLLDCVVNPSKILHPLFPLRRCIYSPGHTSPSYARPDVCIDDVETTWENIALDAETKSRITQMLSLIGQTGPCSGILGRRRIGGALLYGPPGTGKTHVARVIAKSSSATMLQVSAAQIESKWVGETEKMIHALFQLGKRLAPCIIFIDEADALFYSRDFSTHSWEFGRVNQLLGQADGLSRDTTSPFLLLATNYPHKLDHAVLRRVPARLYLDLPTLEAREEIFNILLKEDPLEPDVDIQSLAKATSGYSGSDIEFVCQQAATVALCDLQTSQGWEQTTQRGLSMAHFQAALAVSSPTNSRSIISQMADFATEFDRPALRTIEGANGPSRESSRGSGELSQLQSSQTLQEGDANLGSHVKSQTNLTTCEVTGDQPFVASPENGQQSGMSARVDNSLPLYLPLDKTRQDIRLLEIIKDGSNETQVECALHTVALTGDVCFTALSYVWGDPKMRQDILVNKEVVSVTRSLENALRWALYHWQKKYPERAAHEFRLWADAVCINQADVEEKNHQVPLMDKIYSTAELTLGAIAIDDPDVCEGMKAYSQIYDVLTEGQLRLSELKDLTWLRKIPSLCSDNICDTFPRNSAWRGLKALLSQPYWGRVWIVQEICLSKQLQLICAGESLDFEKILRTVSIGKLVFFNEDDFKPRPDFISERAWCSGCCFDVLANDSNWKLVLLFKRRKNPGPWPELIPLAYQFSRRLHATDMRDYVYGFQGLSETKITIDYRKSVEEVHIDLIKAQISSPHRGLHCGIRDSEGRSEGKCDFLFYAGARMRSSDTAPSWVPNLAAVGSPDPDKPLIAVYGDTFLHVLHPEAIEPRISGSSLHVSGARIGEVKTTVQILEKAAAEKDYVKCQWSQELRDLIRDKVLQNTVGRGEKTALEIILRSLLGHQTGNIDREMIMALFTTFLLVSGYDLDSVHGSRYAHNFARILDPKFGMAFDPQDPREVFHWFIRNVFPGQEQNYDQLKVTECWDPMNLVAKMARLARRNISECIFETDQGMMGTGPSDIETGDTLCVLYSCTRPVVVRQVDDHFIYIGCCWVPELCDADIDATSEELGEDGVHKLEKFEVR